MDQLPDAVPVLRARDTLLIGQFGDLGLRDGDWPLLGRLPRWDRWEWPIPDFGRLEPITGRAWRVRYPDDGPGDLPIEEPVSKDECLSLPRDSSSGAGAVEIILTRLLGPASADVPGGPIAHARGLDWRLIVRDAQSRLASSPRPSLPVVAESDVTASEHAVVVHARLADDGFGDARDRALLDALEAGLIAAVEGSGAGEFDGTETGLGFSTLFLYGPDTDRLYEVVEPALRSAGLRAGSYVVKRYGPPGQDAAEVRVEFS